MSTSTVTYRHENNFAFKKNGVKHTIKENVMDGEKGLSFHYLQKIGEDKFYSITVKQVEDDKFSVREKKGEKMDDRDVNLAELKKMVKSNKDLGFVDNYLTKERGNYS